MTLWAIKAQLRKGVKGYGNLGRMSIRRYTRLTNAFGRKIENHAAAVALYYFTYNFIKIHGTLRMTPAMAAGVTSRLCEVSDLVACWKPPNGD